MKKAVIAGAAALLVLALVSPAWATGGTPHKVDICHRTGSHSNPYVAINVDKAAVDEEGKNDHNGQHEGPIWFPGIEVEWGDIIPPFYDDGSPGDWPSQNWTAEGIVIFEDGCEVPEEPEPTETPTPTETPSPTPTDEPTVSPSGPDKPDKDKDTTRTKRPPKVLAFTGPSGWTVGGLVAAMLLLLTLGTLALRAGRKRGEA